MFKDRWSTRANIYGSNCVPWTLIEADIAYCTEETAIKIDIILYCQYGNNSLEKIKTEGITDLTLFTEKIDFDTEEPNLIVEEDSTVLEDTFPQQWIIKKSSLTFDFEARRFLSGTDLAIFC